MGIADHAAARHRGTGLRPAHLDPDSPLLGVEHLRRGRSAAGWATGWGAACLRHHGRHHRRLTLSQELTDLFEYERARGVVSGGGELQWELDREALAHARGVQEGLPPDLVAAVDCLLRVVSEQGLQ
eukprot:scaffold43568_cov47-Phaeocystis_antarctica.AAC.2